MIIRIDRLKWLRSDSDSMLLRSRDGKMCCLGQVGEACGIPLSELRETGDPLGVSESFRYLFPKFLFSKKKDIQGHLMSVNDDTNLTQEPEKERIIEETFFREAGIIIEFIN